MQPSHHRYDPNNNSHMADPLAKGCCHLNENHEVHQCPIGWGVQTRSETTGLNWFWTFDEALAYAKKDKTVWKISLNAATGERIRLVTQDNGFTWLYESLMDEVKKELEADKDEDRT